MIITSTYNPNTKTILVTDATGYLPGQRELLNLVLLTDGEEVETFSIDSDTVSYLIPTDGIRTFTVASYDAATGELVETSLPFKQLTSEYSFEQNIRSLKAALLHSPVSISGYLERLKIIKAVRSHYYSGNLPKSKQLLKALA